MNRLGKRLFIVLCAVLFFVLQATPARAALMNYTGTFSISVEGFSASQPFHGTADINLATGAFQILEIWSTSVTTSGSYVTSGVAIRPPLQMVTTPSASWPTTVRSHPIVQHPLLSAGGFSQGVVHVPTVGLMSAFFTSGNLFFSPSGGFGGGFGGNGGDGFIMIL